MKSVKFLDDLMRLEGLKNDAELARSLQWATSKISQYRTGKRIMDNEACLGVALKLGIDPIRIIMAADIDRAERAGQHSLWEVFTSRMTATAASVILGISVILLSSRIAPSDTQGEAGSKPSLSAKI